MSALFCITQAEGRAQSSGEAEYFAAVTATIETKLTREVVLLMGLELRTRLLLDSAAARGICRREGVGTVRHLSTQVLWLQQLVKRGVNDRHTSFSFRAIQAHCALQKVEPLYLRRTL